MFVSAPNMKAKPDQPSSGNKDFTHVAAGTEICAMPGDAEVMLEEFLQSAVMAGEKPARTAYAKAGIALLGGLWQSEAASGQLRRLLPGLLYQVLT